MWSRHSTSAYTIRPTSPHCDRPFFFLSNQQTLVTPFVSLQPIHMCCWATNSVAHTQIHPTLLFTQTAGTWQWIVTLPFCPQRWPPPSPFFLPLLVFQHKHPTHSYTMSTLWWRKASVGLYCGALSLTIITRVSLCVALCFLLYCWHQCAAPPGAVCLELWCWKHTTFAEIVQKKKKKAEEEKPWSHAC